MKRIKLVSWNVNGLRAAMKKDFPASLEKLDADVVGLQETKLQADQRTAAMIDIDGYASHWSYASTKKGYSGTAVYTRPDIEAVTTGIGIDRFDAEGRIIEVDFGDFIFFNIYFPNGQMSDERLNYKLDFYKDFFAYTDGLKAKGRSLVIAGDYNTAHNEIDLKNPKANEKRSGFLRIERDWLDEIIARGYVDTFRHYNPDAVKYSWWSYRFKARERNAGWRIDYFFITQDILNKGWVVGTFIDNEILGSDHCPIGLVLEIP
jgi:exodeoxyribonuclease-3